MTDTTDPEGIGMTEPATTDLVAFLRARLDEDERTARACPQHRWEVSGPPPGHYAHSTTSGDLVGWTGPNSRAIIANPTSRAGSSLHHAARHDPTRVLAEVEAKRRIIARIEHHARIVGRDEIHDDLLRLLALPYADRSDSSEERRP